MMKKAIHEKKDPFPCTKNPSRWGQRIALSIISALATLLAIWMGLYQWGLVASVWDPIFGEQALQVLASDASEKMALWIRMPDAILGALAYVGDIIFALAGSSSRWFDRPWIVLLFGLYVIPPALVSIILVFVQGVFLGKWCFLCLITAAVSIGLIFLAYQEVWTSLKFLYLIWRKNKKISFAWRALWGFPSPAAYEVLCTMKGNYVGAHR